MNYDIKEELRANYDLAVRLYGVKFEFSEKCI